jgi:hypothetical protein
VASTCSSAKPPQAGFWWWWNVMRTAFASPLIVTFAFGSLPGKLTSWVATTLPNALSRSIVADVKP